MTGPSLSCFSEAPHRDPPLRRIAFGNGVDRTIPSGSLRFV